MGIISYAPPKLSVLEPGYRLDRYELLCPIAEGGMGAVWLARQRGKFGFRKLVAVKTILPSFASEPDFRELFLDEARLVARIDHTNVAQVLDLGEEHDVLYLVIEWVDGDSLYKLAKVIAKKSLSLPHAILLRILSDACLGLHAAHELRDYEGKHLGVVHRDVSPQNILVSAHGTSKVIDFGIAKARDRLTQETRMGVVKGKFEYMSPEQALGQAVDVRTDVWALGAVFYRLVTGQSPFDAACQASALNLLGTGQFPIPPSAIPGVHPAVCAVMERALAPRPAGRFASALEMHDALQAAMTTSEQRASQTEVQAFVARHLGERMKDRRKTIQIALDAAVRREGLASIAMVSILESDPTTKVLGAADSLGGVATHTSITKLEEATKLDEHARARAVDDAVANGVGTKPRAARARPRGLALLLVLGTGGLLTLALRAESRLVAPSKSSDSIGAVAPPPAIIDTVIPPSIEPATAVEPADATSGPPSPSSPVSSATGSLRKAVVSRTGLPRPRPLPRAGTPSPRHTTEDGDGI
jgi:serine/threonine protein kinase